MRVYLSFTIALAVATAAVRRNDGYWNVQDPPRVSSHGLGAFMTAMNVILDAFADVIDETQLSLELYFYARELNRADHLVLGLAPPGVGLLPPGEADVFAGRA